MSEDQHALLPPDQAIREAALAIDRSLILQAPAGSGKTTLLANRVLHLLTCVSRPEEILAITFTRKAAGEMRDKVLQLLREDSALAITVRARSEALGWELQRNPHRLQIQTIDGFALQVASSEPSAATLLGVQIEASPQDQYLAAAHALFARLFDPDDPVARLVGDFLAFLDNDLDRAVRLIVTLLGKRDQWLATTLDISQQSSTASVTLDFLEHSIVALHKQYTDALALKLSDADRETVQRIAEYLGNLEGLHGVLSQLMTGQGTLRRRVTKNEGFTDKPWRAECNEWLLDLHERGLAPVLEAYVKLPQVPLPAEQLEQLRLVCLGMNLAAVGLEQHFHDQGRTDFTGLLASAKRALRDEQGPTNLALKLDYRIKHILVDEFQDTSRAQLEFFRLLTEHWSPTEDTSFFAVGDPMQSIYRFRDADVAIFAECQQHGIGEIELQALQLQANFRSSPAIVDWVNAVFQSLFDYDPLLPSPGCVDHGAAIAVRQRAQSDQVQCLQFESNPLEIAAIVGHIETLRRIDPAASIAVLCQARPHVLKLLEHLDARGISWQANDMHPLDHEPIVEDLYSLYRTLFNPLDDVAWYALLRSPMVGLTLSEITELSRLPSRGRKIAHNHPAMTRLNLTLEWAEDQFAELTLREWLEGCWLRLGGPLCYPQSAIDHAARWFDLVEQLGIEAENPATLEQAMAQLYAQRPADSLLEVMTIHKAKGLEFDHVIVPHLERGVSSDESSLLQMRRTDRGLLLGLKDDQVGNWLRYEERTLKTNEDKRLLYVAATRAKRSLWMSYTLSSAGNALNLAHWLQPFATEGHAADLDRSGERVGTDRVGPNSSNVAQSDLFASQTATQKFLPPNYRWQPDTYKMLPRNPSPAPQRDSIGARRAVELGHLVHRALAWLGHQPKLPSVASAAAELAQRWSAFASDVMVTTALDALQRQAENQVLATLADPTGQWIMASREVSYFELSIAGMLEGQVAHRTLDRLFIEDGQCWIIDFKSTIPEDADHASFLLREQRRYRDQLDEYAHLATRLFDRPVRTALYFTAVQRFVELTQSNEATSDQPG